MSSITTPAGVTIQELMPITLRGQTAEGMWLVRGAADNADARDHIHAFVPDEKFALPRRDEETAVSEVRLYPDNLFSCTVRYATLQRRPQPLPAGQSRFSFEIGVASVRVTQSYATRIYSPPFETAPDFKGAIGVSDSGVEGVEISEPTPRFSETHVIPVEQMSLTYILALEELVGKVNSQTFRGRPAHEVLATAVSGSEREAGGDWEIRFDFARRYNRTSIIANGIEVALKRGWEHLEYVYDEQEDATAKRIVKRAIGAYVHQVYDTLNFNPYMPS